MRAFEVHLNGKKLCVAGIGDDGVLTTIVSWATRKSAGDLFLQVGGLVSPTAQHVAWVEQKPLGVGDEVRIRVIEADSVDEATPRQQTHSAEQLQSQKRYVREMAKKFGWKIETPSEAADS